VVTPLLFGIEGYCIGRESWNLCGYARWRGGRGIALMIEQRLAGVLGHELHIEFAIPST
jgi:hypothetical protein